MTCPPNAKVTGHERLTMKTENAPTSAPVDRLVGRNSVVPSSRVVIENQLLAAMDDKTKVAILATKDDLDFLLSVLECGPSDYSTRCDWIADLSQLRRSAFGD